MENPTVKGASLLGDGFRAEVDYVVKVYDFKRPDKFSKDQIRTVAAIHETFARLSSTVLSTTLRILGHVSVASVDQLTFEEFLRSVPDPTVLAVIPMEPMKNAAVLEIDPSISFAIVDRLLGGRGDPTAPKREITELECELLSGEITRLLGGLRDAWGTIRPLEMRLANIETRAQFCQVVHPHEMVVLVSFETRVGEATGFMNLCIPFLTIEPMIPQLSAAAFYSHMMVKGETERADASDLGVSAEISHAGEVLSLTSLQGLRRGSMVRVPDYEEGAAFLHAGGSPLFRLDRKAGTRTRAPAWTFAQGARHAGRELVGITASSAPGPGGDAASDLQSLAERIGSAFKAIEDRMAAIARGQEKLSDQLLFEAPEKLGEGATGKAGAQPFAGISIGDCDPLAGFLSQEHPQLIALVLSHLEPAFAACVLERIPEEMRTDVTERVCAMNRTAPEVLRMVETVLEKKMAVVSDADHIAAGGVDAVVEILNVGTRGLEKFVVESMEKTNPQLAEEIKKRMFVFEDIVLLDRETVAKILKEVAEEDLLLSLKATEEKVRAFIWECVPRAAAEGLRARLEQVGRARLSDIDAAQQKIVAVIRAMEEEGKIIVARPDEVVD